MRKIPTLFVRDFTRDNGRYVTEEITPGCEWVLAGEGQATRKFDGTCIMVDRSGRLFARREVKRGKQPPPGFVEVERDDATGKAVGWEPAEQSSFAKYIDEATERQPDLPWGETYELVGPKVNRNPERRIGHELISHRDADRLYLQVALTFDSIREDVLACAAEDGMEGIVWHHPDGRMAKIKARDFRPDLGGGA